MRGSTNKGKIQNFMAVLGRMVAGEGTIYLTGGVTALLYGWRETTIDIDIKPDPEPAGLFEVLAEIKNKLDLNIEIASPDQFIPAVEGWKERSLFIKKCGKVQFFHYDPYGQVLSKLQRRHDRDLIDAKAFVDFKLVDKVLLKQFFKQIKPRLIRFPSIDSDVFSNSVIDFCERES